MPKVVMISGKKGSGKDTVGAFIAQRVPGAVCLAFADRLKFACNALFDIAADNNWSAELKETPTQFNGKTPRQLIGELSEFVRERYGQTHFIDRTLQDARMGDVAVITDTRRRLEIAAFKEVQPWTYTIRIERPSLQSIDTSIWETELDSYESWDAVVTNDGTLEELENKIQQLLINWELL